MQTGSFFRTRITPPHTITEPPCKLWTIWTWHRRSQLPDSLQILWRHESGLNLNLDSSVNSTEAHTVPVTIDHIAESTVISGRDSLFLKLGIWWDYENVDLLHADGSWSFEHEQKPYVFVASEIKVWVQWLLVPFWFVELSSGLVHELLNIEVQDAVRLECLLCDTSFIIDLWHFGMSLKLQQHQLDTLGQLTFLWLINWYSSRNVCIDFDFLYFYKLMLTIINSKLASKFSIKHKIKLNLDRQKSNTQ